MGRWSLFKIWMVDDIVVWFSKSLEVHTPPPLRVISFLFFPWEIACLLHLSFTIYSLNWFHHEPCLQWSLMIGRVCLWPAIPLVTDLVSEQASSFLRIDESICLCRVWFLDYFVLLASTVKLHLHPVFFFLLKRIANEKLKLTASKCIVYQAVYESGRMGGQLMSAFFSSFFVCLHWEIFIILFAVLNNSVLIFIFWQISDLSKN